MTDEIATTAEAHEAAAMPRKVDIHTDDPDHCGEQPLPDTLRARSLDQKSPAEWAYERIILYIQEFEKQLDDAHEMAMGFAGNDAGILRIEGMGFFDPDIVTFYGTDPSGAKMQLIEHVSQLSVTLRALPKDVSAVEPRRIGFRLANELSET